MNAIRKAAQTFTPRRLKPFTWSWFFMKITCAPLAAGLLAFVFIGFTNTEMIHYQVEGGTLVQEYRSAPTEQQMHQWWCDQLRADPDARVTKADYITEECK